MALLKAAQWADWKGHQWAVPWVEPMVAQKVVGWAGSRDDQWVAWSVVSTELYSAEQWVVYWADEKAEQWVVSTAAL